ncbi:MAG: CPBP family intramembrane metalloprotease [Planctomycetes bacterium]|nr:CPBP family intramembrane metalloprotease [Planctomycetota bacterium]
MALPAALVTLGAAHVYLGLLTQGATDPGREHVEATTAMWIAVVVLAPLGEEWLCRGVAWRSAVTLSSPRTALLLTAILFAFLHGLGGGYLLELPHRFAMGLVAGWLRWQSGSLLPGIVVHAVHNFVAITWLG